ncbi:hypothetical protein FOBRF1_005442 [Fusarium oxysporum]
MENSKTLGTKTDASAQSFGLYFCISREPLTLMAAFLLTSLLGRGAMDSCPWPMPQARVFHHPPKIRPSHTIATNPILDCKNTIDITPQASVVVRFTCGISNSSSAKRCFS